jgi:hypothetical protein
VQDGCAPCNECKSPRECKKDLHCTPPSKIKVIDDLNINNCSAAELNRKILEINDSCYDEVIIMIPPGVIKDKVCLNTTRKVTLCGDPCHPTLFTDHVVSCGNKKLTGINLGGNGIYQLNESCGVCTEPEVFDDVQVTCNRSFVSDSRAGFAFVDGLFNVRQNGDFVIRMSQGNLFMDNNTILIDPSNSSVAFAYYDGGDLHTLSDNEVKVTAEKCSEYTIHLLNKCTQLNSTGNRYYGDGGNIIVFEGDDHPFSTVHSTSDHVEEIDCDTEITLMQNIPGITVFSNSAHFISKLVKLESTTGKVGCNKDSMVPGVTKFSNNIFKNPFPRIEVPIQLFSDFAPLTIDVPVSTFTLEIHNVTAQTNIANDLILAEGNQSFTFDALNSSFIDISGSLTNQILNGEIQNAPIFSNYGSRSVGYAVSENPGGLFVVAASSLL